MVQFAIVCEHIIFRCNFLPCWMNEGMAFSRTYSASFKFQAEGGSDDESSDESEREKEEKENLNTQSNPDDDDDEAEWEKFQKKLNK